eukprot:SAG11_NODE_3984_length_2121_cov_1.696340_2_plen_67_part_00
MPVAILDPQQVERRGGFAPKLAEIRVSTLTELLSPREGRQGAVEAGPAGEAGHMEPWAVADLLNDR